jgi:hypothetical protein
MSHLGPKHKRYEVEPLAQLTRSQSAIFGSTNQSRCVFVRVRGSHLEENCCATKFCRTQALTPSECHT